MNARPKDTTPEEWDRTWENSAHILQPLADVLKSMKKGLDTIKPDDFDCPNHYAKLASQQMQIQLINKVLELLPKKVDK